MCSTRQQGIKAKQYVITFQCGTWGIVDLGHREYREGNSKICEMWIINRTRHG